MKRKIEILLLAVFPFLLLSFQGCGRYEQIKISSVNVESLSINGLRSVNLVLSAKVDNPAGKIVIKDAEGIVRHSGKIIGRVTLAPLALRAHMTAEYKAAAEISLAEGVGLQQLMMLMDVRRLDGYTVDIVFKGKASGIAVKKKYNDIPLKKLLEGNIYEKI